MDPVVHTFQYFHLFLTESLQSVVLTSGSGLSSFKIPSSFRLPRLSSVETRSGVKEWVTSIIDFYVPRPV